jgi:hypothetical protein
MAEIKSRDNNPVPGIDHSEIHIPDENIIGTGTFITVLEPNAMAKTNPIISSIINEPVFQLIVSINLAIESVTVMIGKADNTPPLSRKVFKLPKEIDLPATHRFDVSFGEWKIESLSMDGESLIEEG